MQPRPHQNRSPRNRKASPSRLGVPSKARTRSARRLETAATTQKSPRSPQKAPRRRRRNRRKSCCHSTKMLSACDMVLLRLRGEVLYCMHASNNSQTVDWLTCVCNYVVCAKARSTQGLQNEGPYREHEGQNYTHSSRLLQRPIRYNPLWQDGGGRDE